MLYRDRIKTRLTSDFNIGSTVLNVEDTSDFPDISDTEPMLLVVDNNKYYEVIQAISKTSNSFTVNRIESQKNFETGSLVYTYPLKALFDFKQINLRGNLASNSGMNLIPPNTIQYGYNFFILGIVYHNTATPSPYIQIRLASSSFIHFTSLNNTIGFYLQNTNPTVINPYPYVVLYNPSSTTTITFDALIYYGGLRKIV